MNAAKVLLFSKLASIYDKLCQTCIGKASADPQIFGSDINVGSKRIRTCHTKGGATPGATIPHGRVGLTLKLKDSFSKSADEGGRTVRRISASACPPHKKI